MKKILPAVITVIAIGALVFALREASRGNLGETRVYQATQWSIEFRYPKQYMIREMDASTGERSRYALIIAEDTPENREIFEGKRPGTEFPPAITVEIFQNNIDKYTARQFVETTGFSNFKLSDGKLTEETVGGEPALRYRATGLYENENIVVARPDFVYMFTTYFNAPTDPIRADFERIIGTVKFLVSPNPDAGGGKTVCLPASRAVDFCTEQYEPVCGDVEVQCIKAPCPPVKQTFSNACEACRNNRVQSYTAGECVK